MTLENLIELYERYGVTASVDNGEVVTLNPKEFEEAEYAFDD